MNIITTQALADILEPLVDEHGLSQVVEALALVASAKADHIENNWQDAPLAKHWNKVAADLLVAEYAISTGLEHDHV